MIEDEPAARASTKLTVNLRDANLVIEDYLPPRGAASSFPPRTEALARGVGDTFGPSFCEQSVDVTFKDGNRMTMDQISVRTWKDGLVVKERFVYKGMPS